MSQETAPEDWYIDGNRRWPYDKYLRTYFLKRLEYDFVRENYDRTLDVLREDMARPARSRAWLYSTVDQLEQAGVGTLFELIDCVSTQARAECVMAQAGIYCRQLEGLLDFIKAWIIPYPAQLRQLFDTSDGALLGTFEVFKGHRLANNYVLLERGRSRAGRAALAAQTGLPGAAILDFVHRADVARMPFVSGGVVRQLWSIGYRSLAELRNADPVRLCAQIAAYYETYGKGKPFDATPETARGMVDGARWIPTVVGA